MLTEQISENQGISQRVLALMAYDDTVNQIERVSKALASDKRLAILSHLASHTASVLEIAAALNMPISTTNLHIDILESAGLIRTELQPARRGLQKICARTYDRISIQLPGVAERRENVVFTSMPIGAYVDAQVTPSCGLVGEQGIIGQLDDPTTFFEPERINAQLLWFKRGYVEYRFPNRLPPKATLESLQISFEVCSEAPLYHLNWPSDITLWINGIEIGTWTSPADFGGERGMVTPEWWDITNSQYGLLKVWKVNATGSYVDGIHLSNTYLEDVIDSERSLSVRIGVKDDAFHVGGLNLFGRKFGNYPQDIVLKLHYYH